MIREDWAEIRPLHRAEQMPVRAIARNTVRRAIANDAPGKIGQCDLLQDQEQAC
ncbi:hypothetical protein [Streptomyces werraensis]|uniref:hypothetical protein n=1 Tax=Streptomyces werraensis TaxID=68284 RepID=UPI003800797A